MHRVIPRDVEQPLNRREYSLFVVDGETDRICQGATQVSTRGVLSASTCLSICLIIPVWFVAVLILGLWPLALVLPCYHHVAANWKLDSTQIQDVPLTLTLAYCYLELLTFLYGMFGIQIIYHH